MKVADFEVEMNTRGWVVLPDMVSPQHVSRMLDDIETAYITCREIQTRNGIAAETTNTVHHLPVLSDGFIQFLDDLVIHPYLEAYFGGPYILNSFGGALNNQGAVSYANRIHRDVRSYTREIRLMVNTLVMLDDFTVEKGATRMLSGSHLTPEKPEQADFEANAESAIGKAGSILIFDSNVWHAAGESTSTEPRRSVTPLFTRPFLKQQFDYPRALGYDYGETISESLRQILGYNSRVPATLDEWYQPPQKRMYRPGQG